MRGAVTSQKKNSVGGWRYSPDSNDADTSVSGAVLVGLLGGAECRHRSSRRGDRSGRHLLHEDDFSHRARSATSGGFGGMGQSTARTSIATLDLCHRPAEGFARVQSHAEQFGLQQMDVDSAGPWVEYARYYQAQALFQGDIEAWQKWNKMLVRQLKASQAADGSFPSQLGTQIGTSLSLLALAVNYRFLPIYER